jgi:RNA polymerase sigma-70 factor (ECF subfamily)
MTTADPAKQFIDGFDCADLLARCMAEDRAAGEELARRCLPRVRRTVFLLTGVSTDRDDLVQSAMSRAFSSLHGFRSDGSFRAWLDKVTISTVRNHFRRRPLALVFPGFCPATGMATPDEESPERIAAGKEALRDLEPELLAIRPEKRIALVLSAAYGYSAAEIAGIMGCSAEAAKKRVQHARLELLARLRSPRRKRFRPPEEDRP